MRGPSGMPRVSDQFGSVYADSYDTLYDTKDYEAECTLLEGVFDRYGARPTRSILDLGCGTGKHALILGGRGFSVTGVDRSPSMLALARERAMNLGRAVDFVEGDVRSAALDRRFDAVLLMFAVLGYQLTDKDVTATFRTARRHLVPGGLLVFDVWYGPAVIAQGPSQRMKSVTKGATVIERHAAGRLDPARHRCIVDYRLVITDGATTETAESHTVRYFFDEEIRRFTQAAGLEMARLGAFPDFDADPDETTWNVLAVARAI